MVYGRRKVFYNENVVDLIERPAEKFVKSPRYRSIHNERTKIEYARAKSAHGTLGVPHVQLNPPTNYLRKHSAENRPRAHSSTSHVHYRPPNYQRHLPKWKGIKMKHRDEHGFSKEAAAPSEDKVNFLKKNLENVKNMKSKIPKPKYADTRHGDTHDLMLSGLMPIYVYKKNFGQVPLHLKRSKIDKKYDNQTQEDSMRRAYDEKYIDRKSYKIISEDDRLKLLEEMKKKFAETMKLFQCLPFMIDTPPKVKRKKALEDKLNQLEKDIELFENHSYIYVYDDDYFRY